MLTLYPVFPHLWLQRGLFGDLIQSESLKVILKDYQPTTIPIYAVYRRGRFVPAKVRCFIEYFTNEFKLNPWVSDYGVKQSA